MRVWLTQHQESGPQSPHGNWIGFLTNDGLREAARDSISAGHSPKITSRLKQTIVTVVAGDISTETVVRFMNGQAFGQLKICKIAGDGITQGQTFSISANGVGYQVPAGPASQGG